MEGSAFSLAGPRDLETNAQNLRRGNGLVLLPLQYHALHVDAYCCVEPPGKQQFPLSRCVSPVEDAAIRQLCNIVDRDL